MQFLLILCLEIMGSKLTLSCSLILCLFRARHALFLKTKEANCSHLSNG